MSDSQTWLGFLVTILAIWRLVHLLAHEDGPFDLVVRLRLRAGDGLGGRLMDCPYCLSLWLAILPAVWLAYRIAADPFFTLLLWLAISGGACVIERALPQTQTGRPNAEE